MRCPTCDKVFQPETSPAMPFCCERCRLIDLGRWLDEKQGLPFEQAERDEEVDRGPSAGERESAD
jgi:uncharacterized protein